MCDLEINVLLINLLIIRSSGALLISPVPGKSEINTFTLALVIILLLKGRYTLTLKKTRFGKLK